jgi:flagellar biosynthesis chaperone FliJ
MEKVENKITAEQLEKLNGFVNALNNGVMQLGAIEKQKHELLHQVAQVDGELRGFQKELEDEYGKISINTKDGSYTEIVEDEADTQN